MGIFKNLFSKKSGANTPKGFYTLTIAGIEKMTADTVKVTLDVPSNLKTEFTFKPGQYLDFSIQLNGKEERRSYSICSGKNEPLAVAVKAVENGTVSRWFNENVVTGDELIVSRPSGNFILPETAKKVVAIAAGSGITPIMAFAKALSANDGSMDLFYGNRTEDSILFRSEIDALSAVNATYFLSAEDKEGFKLGRIDTTTFSILIKENLQLLKADYFVLCGPEQMIAEVSDVLKTFGVSPDKIKYELFTTPVLLKSETEVIENTFEGLAKVTVILDDDKISYELASKGPSILEKTNKEGMDAPYSCKGGVCSTCKAKVLKGSCTMTMNYALTDKEVQEGYILTCQAHPAEAEIVVSYDE